MGKVVGGRPQAAGGDHEVRPGGGLREGVEASLVVPDGGVTVDRDAQIREPAAEPGRVRVHEAPEEDLGPDGHDLGRHRLPILHAPPPAASFPAVGPEYGSRDDRRRSPEPRRAL